MAILLGFGTTPAQAQQVVLQGFWWDYWNTNYPNGWANYIADLAPRLKAMGIDAVWMPPSIKNSNQGNGYSPFDNYDLGDKYQKGFLPTRLGNKDEQLRGVAILHANGIQVIQDIVLNHNDGAGSASGQGGQGGQDPAAWEDGTTSKYKNFRYVSFTKPATDETAANYLARNTSTANPAQRAFVKTTYTAPTVVTGAMTGRRGSAAGPEAEVETASLRNGLGLFPNPNTSDKIDLTLEADADRTVTVRVYDLTGRLAHEEATRLYPGSSPLRLNVAQPLAGSVYQLTVAEMGLTRKLVLR